MSASALSAPEFHDEATAYAVVEACLWPNGPVCPRCGATDRISALKGRSTRIGLRFCGCCRRQFTVKIGTVFEDSHVPMTKWLQAIYLLCSSKKGISSHQLHRTLEVTLKTAWFMAHRLREAMRDGGLAGPMGGEGKVVEADETCFGPVEERRPSKQRGDRPFTKGGRTGPAGKRAIVALVERGGSVRSFHVAVADGETVGRDDCRRGGSLDKIRRSHGRAVLVTGIQDHSWLFHSASVFPACNIKLRKREFGQSNS